MIESSQVLTKTSGNFVDGVLTDQDMYVPVFFFLNLSLFMCEFEIGTLNLSNAREKKRAAFFKLVYLKELDIMSVQETVRVTGGRAVGLRSFLVTSGALVEGWGSVRFFSSFMQSIY